MTDKLREEIKEYWHQSHHYTIDTRVDKIMEIIERECKAAYEKGCSTGLPILSHYSRERGAT